MRGRGGLALVGVADREHDLGAAVGQHPGGVVAQAGVGAGDDGDAARLIGHVGRGPLAVGAHEQDHTQSDADTRRPRESAQPQGAAGVGPRRPPSRGRCSRWRRWCGSCSTAGCGWLHAAAAGGDRARRRDVRRRGAAVAVPGAPLGDRARRPSTPGPAGWCRSAASRRSRGCRPSTPIAGPLDRLFGLANVTVTTASSAGAVRIVALDSDVADRIAAQLTDIAAIGERDAT